MMPRFDLYLTDEDDKLLREVARGWGVTRSAYLRALLHRDAEAPIAMVAEAAREQEAADRQEQTK